MTEHRITMKEMINQAYREHWALGEFNMSTLETLQAIGAAAEKLLSPVIVGVSRGTIRHVGLPFIGALLKAARTEYRIPLFFHLDHGNTLELIDDCIQLGFDSVMIDSSHLPYQDNVQMVQAVVALARPRAVCVEAQIGETWEEEGTRTTQRATDPAEACQFVEETGIDLLAVSIGNTPGQMAGTSSINRELVNQLTAAVPIPLVLHGGSSVPDQEVRTLIEHGIAKVNIDSALRRSVLSTLLAACSITPPVRDPRVIFDQIRQTTARTVEEKIKLIGSSNRVEDLR